MRPLSVYTHLMDYRGGLMMGNRWWVMGSGQQAVRSTHFSIQCEDEVSEWGASGIALSWWQFVTVGKSTQ